MKTFCLTISLVFHNGKIGGKTNFILCCFRLENVFLFAFFWWKAINYLNVSRFVVYLFCLFRCCAFCLNRSWKWKIFPANKSCYGTMRTIFILVLCALHVMNCWKLLVWFVLSTVINPGGSRGSGGFQMIAPSNAPSNSVIPRAPSYVSCWVASAVLSLLGALLRLFCELLGANIEYPKGTNALLCSLPENFFKEFCQSTLTHTWF